MVKRKSHLNRLIALLLCFCMTLSMLPASAFAAAGSEGEEGTGITDTLSGDSFSTEADQTEQDSSDPSDDGSGQDASDDTDGQSEDGGGPSSEEAAGPEEGTIPGDDIPGDGYEQAQDRVLTYEDGDVTVFVTIPADSSLPADTQLRAERMTEESGAYAKAAERVLTDIGAGEEDELRLVPYTIWLEDGEGNEIEAGEPVSISISFNASLLDEDGNEETQPFIAFISGTDDVRFFSPYTAEVDMRGSCVLALGVLQPAAEKDAPGSQEDSTPGDDSQTDDGKQDDDRQEGDAPGSQDTDAGEQAPFHFGYEDINLKASVEVPSDAGIPSDATLHIERASVQTAEYEAAMKALRAGLGTDSKQDIQFVPYHIYFTDAAGSRIDSDGVQVTVQILFYEDVFASDGGSMFTETVMALVTPDGGVSRLETLAADGSVAFDIELAAGALLGPVRVSEKEEEVQEDFTGLMTMEELLALDIDVAGATMFHSDIMPLNMVSGTHWTFDIYYVNEDDYNDVHKTDDFSLKYQMEFHASQNLEKGEVEIRIPRALLKYRDGTPFNPTDIAVPQVKDESQSIEVRNSPFNYYIETDENGVEYLVFFNYRQITSGSNAAWQVVFSHLRSMEIADGTKWSLQAEAEVLYAPEHDGQGGAIGGTILEKASPDPLTGDVDTTAILLSITKEPYTYGGSYCPGLYTENQVKSYITGDIPEEFSGANFSKYKFVVWEVDINGHGNQPFDLWIKEQPGQEGKVVGYKNVSYLTTTVTDIPDRYGDELKEQLAGWENIAVQKKSDDWSQKFRVVVAYPKDIQADTVLTNVVDTTLVPYDLIDEPQTMSADAKWNYQDYTWNYQGDVIGIEKWVKDKQDNITSWVHETDSAGWLEIYKQSLHDDRDIAADFDFKTESICRSFKMTHYIDAKTGELGERIPGRATRVVTVDDAVYAYPGGTDEKLMMTGEDYYFSSVNIKQIDNGYDVYEDLYGPPEDAVPEDNIYQGIKVYAMFAKTDANGTSSDKWEYVGETPWPGAGDKTQVDMVYTFTDEQIAKEPYRIMVVHDTFNYNTTCEIDVTLHVRKTSPVMLDMLDDDPDLVSVQFENLSGVSGQLLQNGIPDDGVGTESYFDGNVSTDTDFYFHDMKDESGNYSEQGIIDFTNNLYGMLLMRSAALAMGKGVGKEAHAFKTGSLTNDVIHSRANATYNLTMYESYIIGSKEIANALLQDYGMEGPNRKSVIFYDLLPYGMKLDPSYTITAGRITDLTGSYKTQPATWNRNKVDVKTTVVDTNYNDTGRTLVAFQVTYSGDTAYVYGGGDSSIDGSGHLFEGWGVNFRGYWDWKDVGVSDLTQNICAVMPADDEPFIAMDNQVYDDDGTHPLADKDDYEPFGPDIDGDGRQEENSVMYAKAILTEELAFASASSIEKLVRADTDEFSEYDTSAVVLEHGGYTYDVTVTNSARPITNIVIFDRLENALYDRTDETLLGYSSVPGDMDFDTTSWQGTFRTIITQGLKDQNIDFAIYYNASRNAKLPVAKQDPKEVLTPDNGWIESDEWTNPPSDVKAIAVSLGSFELQSLQSVSFQICMDAPSLEGTNGATWAYNNPAFYSEVITDEHGATVPQSVIGNSVRVRLGKTDSFEIVKEYADENEIPNGLKGKSFEFSVYDVTGSDSRKPFADQEYALYTLTADGEWKQEPGLRATDADGTLSLNAGQKAVFTDVADADRIVIEESENPFWDPNITKTEEDSRTTFKVQNKARSVLYVQKKVQGSEAIEGDIYKFQLLVNGEPAANIPYWKVDRAYTDGRLPTKLEGGDGTTDGEGKFSMKANEIIAILGAGDFDDEYQVVELDTGDNWFNNETEWKGRFSVNGSSVVITNHYKWKDLYLTKTVNDQDKADAEKTVFTFKVEHIVEQADGSRSYEPVVGNEWTLQANKETIASGTLDEKGMFSCCAAAGVICISALEAGERYLISEVLTDETTGAPTIPFYEAVNGGTAEVAMPLYANTSTAAITNNWLKRPLTVSKTLVYDFEDTAEAALAKSAVFEMTVKIDADGDGVEEPLADYPFTLTQGGVEVHPGDQYDPYTVKGSAASEFKTDADGKFYIMGSQVATFKDAGVSGSSFTVAEIPDAHFTQISPADDAAFTGSMTDEGGSAIFVNGIATGIIIQKEYVGADEAGEQYIEAARSGDADLMAQLAIDIQLSVTASDGRTSQYPSTDADVAIVSQDGSVTTKTWKAGEPFSLNPWETLVITSGLSGIETFSVTESTEDQHWIKNWTGSDRILHHMQSRQLDPKDDAAAKGSIDDNPMVTFTNELSETGERSKVRKRFLSVDTEVPTNARLILQVERYEGGIWKSASDVSYILCDEDGPTSDRVLHTEKDGKICLTKTEAGNPCIIFTQDVVYALDVIEPKPGDMRVREIIEESDPEWGRAVGVGSWDDNESYTTDLTELKRSADGAAESFVNVRSTSPVRIGKSVEGDSDEIFTFILCQITGIDGSLYDQDGGITPNNYQSVITETAIQSGIRYIVYDEETGRPISEGETDANGTIRLQGGQYAELDLPEGTLWLVREEVPAGFVLQSMSEVAGQSKIGKLADNLMLIGQDVGYQSEGIEPIAMLFEDGTLVFSTRYRTEDRNYGQLKAGPWSGFEKDTYSSSVHAPWYSNRTDIKHVKFETEVAPISTSYWFHGCSKLTDVDTNNLDTTSVTDMSGMFYFCSSLDTLDLSGWNTGKVTNMGYMFYNCSKLTTLDLNGWEAGSVKNMSYMFDYCSKLTTLDVSGWEIGNVTNMSYMFSLCSSLTTLDVSSWETGSVTTMSYMFNGCSKLTTLDVSSWETGSVTNMADMFYSCSSLDTLDVSSWETGSVTDMSRMFYYCSSLDTLDVSGWETGSVKSMIGMFYSCSSLTTLDLRDWDTGSVTNMNSMFSHCSKLTTLDLNGWETKKVTDMSEMFYQDFTLYALDVSDWDTGSVTNMLSMFDGCGRLTSLNVSGWDTGSVTSMSKMFRQCSSLDTLDVSGWDTGSVTNMSYMFSACSLLNILDVSFWSTRSVTNLENMFYNCFGLRTLNLRNWDTSNVTNMSYMFYSCAQLNTIFAHDWTWITPPTSSSMFYGCKSLSGDYSAGGIYYDSSKTNCTYCKSNGGYFTTPNDNGHSAVLYEDGTLVFTDDAGQENPTHGSIKAGPWYGFESQYYNSKNDVPWYSDRTLIKHVEFETNISPISTAYWFYECNNLEDFDSTLLDTSQVRNMSWMFYYCSSLTTLDVSGWETGSVTNMQSMFYYCRALTTLDVSGWETGSVTDMSRMFDDCSSLTTLDVSGWETGSVKNMQSMFYSCRTLTTLDVSGWDTGSVKDMSYMFCSCSNLDNLNVNGWKTDKVTDMRGMFKNCSSLDTFNLSDWDTSRVTDMYEIFYSCSNMTTLDVSGWDTSRVTNMEYMFTFCSSLTILDLSGWNTGKVTDMEYMFYSCSKLTTIYAHDWTWTKTPSSSYMFYNCTKLSGHSTGGIPYDSSKTDHTYCKSNGGYFTDPSQKPSTSSLPSLDSAITFLQSIPIRK